MYGMQAPKGLSTAMQAKYMVDPRLAMAQELAKSGSSTAPVSSNLEGIARMLQGGIAGFQMQDLQDEYQKRGQDYSQALLKAQNNPNVQTGVPAFQPQGEPKPLVPAVAPGMDTIVANLMSGKNADNPDVQEYVQQLRQKDLESKNAMRYKLQEVYDPSSPSGTRFVSEADAMGRAGKPSKSQRISVGPDGSVTIDDGILGIGGGKGLAKPTVNKIEEKALDSSEALSRLNDINKTFKPEFLQLGTRAGAKLNEMKDFVGSPLTPEEKTNLEDFTVFRQNTTQNLNKTIKDLTGSAMGVEEADRIISTVPNAGSGIFDGDAPTSFKSKLDNSTTQTKNAVIRMNWAKANGLNPLKTGVELHEVPALVNREAKKIETEIRAKNPTATDEQVQMQTKILVGKKFGLK